jgi:hypothetical protein
VLCDLKLRRGRDEAADFNLAAILQFVKEFRSGTLPDDVTSDANTMKWLRETSDKVPADVPLTFDRFKASVSCDVAKSFWSERTKAYNFLKHADRDADAHIAAHEINNFELLTLAAAAHIGLVGQLPGPEGLAFALYCGVELDRMDGVDEPMRSDGAKLKGLKPEDRREFCSRFIAERRAPSTGKG